MKFLPGEKELYASPSGVFKVTTHRVRYDGRGGGTAIIKSIMLEQVASCAMIRKTYPLLLHLAGICLIGGLFAGFAAGIALVFAGIFFAMILVIAYFLLPEQEVAIASAGATIFLNTQGWTIEEVRELIDVIEAAKNGRYFIVRSPPVAAIKS